jgi:uncharacterized phage protein (TIGR02218 family)
MSYLIQENSADSGMPILLVDFAQGGETYRFTTYDKVYSYTSNDYFPSAFEIDRIKQSADPFKNDISFTFPLSNEFAFNQTIYKNSEATTVTLRRGHVNDGEFEIVFVGRVIGRELNDTELKVVCESIFTKLRSVGIRAKYEHYCRHTLFSTLCGADRGLYTNIGVVDTVTNNTLVISELSARANGFFDLGVVEINGVKRAIETHVGSSIVLLSPFNEDVLGFTATVTAGCNRTFTVCNTKFSNTINFGGFPYIPVRNPFEGSPY